MNHKIFFHLGSDNKINKKFAKLYLTEVKEK